MVFHSYAKIPDQESHSARAAWMIQEYHGLEHHQDLIVPWILSYSHLHDPKFPKLTFQDVYQTYMELVLRIWETETPEQEKAVMVLENLQNQSLSQPTQYTNITAQPWAAPDVSDALLSVDPDGDQKMGEINREEEEEEEDNGHVPPGENMLTCSVAIALTDNVSGPAV
ncbi:hypothetical protein C8J56DRAFT_113691 [Mycena floridula]|nr:hypothetical protein C8J56DRAFT_113691 [Mycena floridula]